MNNKVIYMIGVDYAAQPMYVRHTLCESNTRRNGLHAGGVSHTRGGGRIDGVQKSRRIYNRKTPK